MDELQAVAAALGPGAVALIALTVAFAGFLRGFVGFGAALIIAMVLSAILGPTLAVPIATLSGLPATLQLLHDARRHADAQFVLPFGVAAFVAAPAGAWVLVSLDAAVMRMLISTFVLLMVVLLVKGWHPFGRVTPKVSAIAGAAAGWVQGASSVSGPLAVLVALSRPGEAHVQRANVIGVVASLNMCGLLPFFFFDLFTLEVVIISLAIIPLYSGTTWLGARYFSAHGHQIFRTAALGAMAFIGVVTFGYALMDFVRQPGVAV